MKILALDISCAAGSVAVADGGSVTTVRRFEAPRGRGAEVFSVLDELRPAWNGLDRIAVGVGPGSYNGLRAACALAASFRNALGIEAVAAPSPCLLDAKESHYFVAGDARGGMVYVAEVRDRRLLHEIRLVDRAEFPGLAGGGQQIPFYRVGTIEGADALAEGRPDAAVLALLAPSLQPLERVEPEPIYLKPPRITTPRAGRT